MAESTSILAITGDTKLERGIVVINPNDGYDLGLLSNTKQVKIHGTVTNASGNVKRGYLFDGEIRQEPSCKVGTVEVNTRFASLLGNPRYVRLYLESSNLIVSNCFE